MLEWKSDDPRRRLLISALAAGFFSGSAGEPRGERAGAGHQAGAAAAGAVDLPDRRAGAGRRTAGHARDARRGRATVETGPNSEVVYTVGQSAFIQRSDSHVALESEGTRFADRVWGRGC